MGKKNKALKNQWKEEQEKHHPKHIVSTTELSRWLWQHLPVDQFEANARFLATIGDSMYDQSHWLCPEESVIATKEYESNEGEYFWSVKRSFDPVDYCANFDGDRFFVILENQLHVVMGGVMPIGSTEVKIGSPILGRDSVICSREFLLAGYHPQYVIHEYCLSHNLYRMGLH